MEMKQMLLAVGVAAVLAGCGKDAGGYEGYWREKSDKKEGMIAVKKEKAITSLIKSTCLQVRKNLCFCLKKTARFR